MMRDFGTIAGRLESRQGAWLRCSARVAWDRVDGARQ